MSNVSIKVRGIYDTEVESRKLKDLCKELSMKLPPGDIFNSPAKDEFMMALRSIFPYSLIEKPGFVSNYSYNNPVLFDSIYVEYNGGTFQVANLEVVESESIIVHDMCFTSHPFQNTELNGDVPEIINKIGKNIINALEILREIDPSVRVDVDGCSIKYADRYRIYFMEFCGIHEDSLENFILSKVFDATRS